MEIQGVLMGQPNGRDGHRSIVMVVDDSPSIRDMVSWALELEGYEPVEATEGQEALAWIIHAAREGRYPSVILLDLAMPGMDGRTFLKHLRDQWQRGLPLPAIVVITAGTEQYDETDWEVQEVVVKPFRVRQLLDVVHQLTD